MTSSENGDIAGQGVSAFSSPEETDSKRELEDRLAEILGPVLRPDRAADIKIAVSRAVEIVQTSSYRGPLPPPAHLRGYEKVLPGAAERILSMAEREQNHRHLWERRHLMWDGITSIAGLIFGWLLSLALAGGAVYCASIGQPWVAGALVGVSAFGGVVSLIRGRRLFGKADHLQTADPAETHHENASRPS
jgi:uncharacterized membrane protein